MVFYTCSCRMQSTECTAIRLEKERKVYGDGLGNQLPYFPNGNLKTFVFLNRFSTLPFHSQGQLSGAILFTCLWIFYSTWKLTLKGESALPSPNQLQKKKNWIEGQCGNKYYKSTNLFSSFFCLIITLWWAATSTYLSLHLLPSQNPLGSAMAWCIRRSN